MEQESKQLEVRKELEKVEQERIKGVQEREEPRIEEQRNLTLDLEKRRLDSEAKLKTKQEARIATQLQTFADQARCHDMMMS